MQLCSHFIGLTHPTGLHNVAPSPAEAPDYTLKSARRLEAEQSHQQSTVTLSLGIKETDGWPSPMSSDKAAAAAVSASGSEESDTGSAT